MVSIKEEADRVIVRLNPWLFRGVFLLLAVGLVLQFGQTAQYIHQRFLDKSPLLVIQNPLVTTRQTYRLNETVYANGYRYARVAGTVETELRIVRVEDEAFRRVDFPKVTVPNGVMSSPAGLWIVDTDTEPGRYKLAGSSLFRTEYGDLVVPWETTEFDVVK